MDDSRFHAEESLEKLSLIHIYLSATTMSGNIEFSDVEATEIVKLDTASGGQLLRGVNTATLDARMGLSLIHI